MHSAIRFVCPERQTGSTGTLSPPFYCGIVADGGNLVKNGAFRTSPLSPVPKADRLLPVEIIAAKRDGLELTDDQIADFIQGYSEERIPDYQMSALAMAIFLNGMTDRETATLTYQMLLSGTQLQWPDDGIPRVDKHSTGGVGDKISIPLTPLLAACDVQVPMLSGRGLGPTGGTLDKLEAIPGFRTDLTLEEVQSLTQAVGGVITGASAELAPADRRLYALRDVTATVPCIPLITASIMSKKLAESLDALLLDVKFGSGAFMKSRQEAETLARSLVNTGARSGVSTTALLTDMNQPLGQMCGNAVEVVESIAVLKGGGPEDVRALTLKFAAELLHLAGRAQTFESGLQAATEKLDSGHAFEKFGEMVRAQSGDLSADLRIAPASDIVSQAEGVVTQIDTEQIGHCIIAMRGGRRVLTDTLDHSVGIEMLVRLGDPVEVGQPLARVFSKSPEPHINMIHDTVKLGETAIPPALVVDRISNVKN